MWTPKLTSQAFSRVLALERLHTNAENEISALKLQLTAVLQEIWKEELALSQVTSPPTSPPPTSCGTLEVTVQGCANTAVGAGYTVELHQGSTTISTAATNTSGVASLPFYTSGTYSVVIPASGLFATTTLSSIVLNCGNTTLAGTIFGCGSHAVSCDIVVTNTSTGTILAKTSQAEGGTFITPSFFLSTGTNITIRATSTSGRFTATSVSSVYGPGANTGFSLTMTVASGYTCTSLFPEPLKNTLICHDDTFGDNATLTYGGGGSWAGASSHGFIFTTSGNLTCKNGANSGSPAMDAGATGPPSLLIHYTAGAGGVAGLWVPGSTWEIHE